ncbi:MAG TPA: hypothetical protein VIQ00_09490 [Chitinophagaceae bacterium]
MILERVQWKEYHPNGQVWITGEIGVIAPMWRHLYNFRTGFKGYEGKPVCRLGKWTKHFDNGQLAWTIQYDEYGFATKDKFPSFRKDGAGIILNNN